MQHINPDQTHPPAELRPDRPPSAPEQAPPASRKPRGFAAMDRKLVSEIARKGGKAAHAAGTAHEFTGEEARAAGRKGGLASHAKRRQRQEEQRQEEQKHGGA
jgi:general stress protein YciG